MTWLTVFLVLLSPPLSSADQRWSDHWKRWYNSTGHSAYVSAASCVGNVASLKARSKLDQVYLCNVTFVSSKGETYCAKLLAEKDFKVIMKPVTENCVIV